METLIFMKINTKEIIGEVLFNLEENEKSA